MTIWCWTEKFTDIRYCTVEANTLEEAKQKIVEGDWASEDTIDFYSEGVVKSLSKEVD